MKTILHIIDTTGPGGAETVFIDLATRLPTAKYRSVVVIRGKGWVYEELCRRGVEPILLDAKGSFHWRYLMSLIKLIRRMRVDLIQSHLLGANVYCALASLITRIPLIATFHGEVDIGANERLKNIKMGIINLGANRVVAVSQGLRNDILRRTNLDKRKVVVIYNGIDTEAFRRQRSQSLMARFNWPEGTIVIGCLGNIRPAKGYDILLEAVSILKPDYLHLRFVVAGQPDNSGLFERLKIKQKELNLDNTVEFLGFLDDPAQYLANLDLFLSTSISEGLPLSAIQAMASGLPLLATKCGGYEELVTSGENGLLVETGNPAAIAEAIKMLLASPALRKQIGSNATRHVQTTFDVSVMYANYQEMYDNLLGV